MEACIAHSPETVFGECTGVGKLESILVLIRAQANSASIFCEDAAV